MSKLALIQCACMHISPIFLFHIDAVTQVSLPSHTMHVETNWVFFVSQVNLINLGLCLGSYKNMDIF